MGCQIVLMAGEESVLAGQRRLAELERTWSRFLPDSELNALNASAGHGPQRVSTATMVLVERCLFGWRSTGGLFDPTVFDALMAAGYDRSFELLSQAALVPTGPGAAEGSWAGTTPAPGCEGIEVDWARGTVRLPAGTHLDPGGIGKGLAADLVVADALAEGSPGAMASVGGDIRVCGQAPDGGCWRVAIEGPPPPAPDWPGWPDHIAAIELNEGAVATSNVARGWLGPRGRAHHVIDPATGQPTGTDLIQVSVATGRAWWAEVLATAALTAGSFGAKELLELHGVHAVLVHRSGHTSTVGDGFELLSQPDQAPNRLASQGAGAP